MVWKGTRYELGSCSAGLERLLCSRQPVGVEVGAVSCQRECRTEFIILTQNHVVYLYSLVISFVPSHRGVEHSSRIHFMAPSTLAKQYIVQCSCKPLGQIITGILLSGLKKGEKVVHRENQEPLTSMQILLSCTSFVLSYFTTIRLFQMGRRGVVWEWRCCISVCGVFFFCLVGQVFFKVYVISQLAYSKNQPFMQIHTQKNRLFPGTVVNIFKTDVA